MSEITRTTNGVTLTIENHGDGSSLRIPLGRVEIREAKRDQYTPDLGLPERHKRYFPMPPVIDSLTLDGTGMTDDGRTIRVHVCLEFD